MKAALRVGFCVSGGGRLFRAAVRQASQLGISPALAVAERNAADDLGEFCSRNNVPFHRLDAQDRTTLSAQVDRLCLEAQLDLLCLTFNRILSRDLVARYAGRIINVHMGLLPAFKGLGAVDQTLRFGARFAGATIHEVSDEVDGGPIIAQCLCGVRRHDSPESVGARLFGLLRLMFLQVLCWYAAGRVAKDPDGRIWVSDAVYGELPISPAVEEAFPD